jgi:DNA-binding response OmpR family regulator
MSARILYIDDEQDLVDLAASFFQDENMPIDVSTSFNHALELIKQNRYDLIISDAKMPSGNGHDLYQLITKEGLFRGKFILVTGNVDPRVEKHALDYDLVMLKPIQFADLINKAKSVLNIQL